ncbi:MAG: MarR family transcriptional regulator [Spirochaetes bacterium]|nr:MarR family transcriptional regulator [Spirochaetota bacterium]
MKDRLKLLNRAARIQYRIDSNNKRPRPFGTSYLMYQSEIHFIDAIGPGDGLNASELSRKLGITNGAVTQIAAKLLEKNLILKYRKDENKKEVYLKLTEEGVIAFENHRLFHKELNDRMLEYLEGLSGEQIDVISGLMDVIENYLPDIEKEEEK